MNSYDKLLIQKIIRANLKSLEDNPGKDTFSKGWDKGYKAAVESILKIIKNKRRKKPI